MANFVKSELQQLAYDAINTDISLGDAVREKIKEICGGEWNYYRFMDKKNQVFEIISELMPAATQAGLGDKFNGFADFKDTAMGDKPYFVVEDNKNYPVYTSARGNGDIERHKIVDRNFKVDTDAKSIKFYDELDMFMANKIDLGRLTEKAVSAHGNYVGQLIATTIYNSYSSVGTDYKATGSFDADTLLGIIEQVKSETGAERLQIFGSVTALANISDGFGYSDGSKDSANQLGFYDTFRGTDLIALPQAKVAGGTTFAVNNSYVIILPADEKIVKVLFEGEPFVGMADNMDRNDLQTEILYSRRIGAAAITAVDGAYGLYKFA